MTNDVRSSWLRVLLFFFATTNDVSVRDVVRVIIRLRFSPRTQNTECRMQTVRKCLTA